jgi:hypothetical protein
MQLQVGMPICWVYQAAAGVPAVRKPGRVTELPTGGVRIRIFDEELNAWAYPVVKPITLRTLDPAAAAALEKLERRVPVSGDEILPHSSTLTAPTQQPAPVPIRDEPPVRFELHVRSKDADLVRCVLRALGDPQRAEATRALLRSHFGREGVEGISPEPFAPLSESLEWTMAPGKLRGRHADLDIRVAYRVLVMRDRCGAVARKLGITSLSVRDRVRRGFDVALDHAADPALERYRRESIPMLRRRAAALRPALEKAFLHISAERAKQKAPDEKTKERRPYRRDVPLDFDVRLAYRVLVGEEPCDAVGRTLGMTGERVLQRLRNGVNLALDHAADPQLDKLRSVGLRGWRQDPSLKSVLERMLSRPQVEPQAATAVRTFSARPR